MSRAKAMGSLKLLCQNCGKEHEVNGDKLKFRYNQSIDKGTSIENEFIGEYIFNCDCKERISLLMWASEYPALTLFGDIKYLVTSAERKGDFKIYFY